MEIILATSMMFFQITVVMFVTPLKITVTKFMTAVGSLLDYL